MHRYCTSAKKIESVFRKPISFETGWDTTENKKWKAGVTTHLGSGGIYLPKCPKGFVKLGDVAKFGTNG